MTRYQSFFLRVINTSGCCVLVFSSAFRLILCTVIDVLILTTMSIILYNGGSLLLFIQQRKGASFYFKYSCLAIYFHIFLSLLKLVGGAMEETGSPETGMNNQDQLMNSKCNELSDTASQHTQSNCFGLESTGPLEEAEYITKNRKHPGSTCCSQESREETPGREEARTDPPDGQQDPEIEKHKEKTLGMFSLAFAFLNGFNIFVV